ncbi:hypothetical protein ILUMI_16389 [Ignelater luminosus]|uniref:Uncharacterized protein n=1 Tax=Ignelater luminosus TaxID=2038154 RepID=A0A8K0G895_IGNLU|nr:hypothetical protein ILUMI_16389 [Ignelater luminosus]
MTKKDEENIRRPERKILRAIVGPKKINEYEYKRRTNEEIEEYSDDIIKRIKVQIAKWYGHILRSEENNNTKIITNWEAEGKLRRGRPRSNWLKEVREDLARPRGKSKEQKKMVKDMPKN